MPADASSSPGRSAAAELQPPIRVAHVVHCLGAGDRTGGMEYGVIKLVNGLPVDRVASAICSTRPSSASIRALLAPHVTYHESTGRPRGNDPRLVWSLARFFRRFRPDIVHTHAWGTLIEGLLAARLARVPAVVHGEHGTLQTKPRQLWTQRAAWSRVNQVVSVSSRLAERLARDVGFDPARVRTIRNGVDLGRFRPALRPTARGLLGLEDQELAIGTVGRLVDVKDHVTLVRAFATVVRDHPRARLLIAGEGPLRDRLQTLVGELGLTATVRLLGHRADVEQVLAALDVFVLSSVSEGLSNTILEAMASGVAVVATHVGGADELVVPNETGLLVPSQDAAALAAAIATLAANDAQRVSMGEAASHRAHTEFSLATMIEGYERLYRDVVHRRRESQQAAVSSPSSSRVSHR